MIFALLLMFPGWLLRLKEGTGMCYPWGSLFWTFQIPLRVIKITKFNSSPPPLSVVKTAKYNLSTLKSLNFKWNSPNKGLQNSWKSGFSSLSVPLRVRFSPFGGLTTTKNRAAHFYYLTNLVLLDLDLELVLRLSRVIKV